MTQPPEILWDQERKIASLAPSFGNKVLAIMQRLRLAGWQPHIVYAWRSAETQAHLKSIGASRTLDSKHRGTGDEGTGKALDLVDSRHWWGAGEHQKVTASHRFWGAMVLAAKEEGGIVCGSDWGWDHAHLEAAA